MAEDFEITCPHCSKTLSGDKLIKDHLEQVKKDWEIMQKKTLQAQAEAKRAELDARRAEHDARRAEAEARKKK